MLLSASTKVVGLPAGGRSFLSSFHGVTHLENDSVVGLVGSRHCQSSDAILPTWIVIAANTHFQPPRKHLLNVCGIMLSAEEPSPCL